MRRRRTPWWFTPFSEVPKGEVWFDRRRWPDWASLPAEQTYAPSFDFYEKEGKYYLNAEMPGVKKEDVSIEIDNNVLTIKGKRASEKEEEGADYYVKESVSGSFSRSVRLPSEVEEEDIEATFEDGILRVVMPHKGKPKARRIQIAG
jgi:HSP20 family protein